MVNHYLPTSLKEALDLLQKEELEIIAGGTDLMVQRRNWANTKPNFKSTINIININDLKYIVKKDNHIHIGSTTSMTDILNSEIVPELLRKAIFEIASPALRNVATIAGNIGNASPAGDTLPILYLLDAKVTIVDLNKEVTVPIEEVILGPRRTILSSNQLIKEIIIPPTSFTKTSFVKVGGRKADAISKLSFTGAVKINNNMIEDIRFAFGAVGPTIIRHRELEKNFQHISVKKAKENVEKLAKEYSPYITPIDDQRSTKKYRKQVSINLLKEFITTL